MISGGFDTNGGATADNASALGVPTSPVADEAAVGGRVEAA